MRKPINIILYSVIMILQSCNSKPTEYNFTIKGNIKNVSNQKIYLEELYFSEKNPEVVDTADIVNGIFSLSAKDSEEGLYRIRLEKDKSAYIVINDQKEISFLADIDDPKIINLQINSTANKLLKTFMLEIESRNKILDSQNKLLDSLKNQSNDSISNITASKIKMDEESYKTYLTTFIKNCTDPVVSMFAMGYSQNLEVDTVKNLLKKLSIKFSEHNGIKGLVDSYNKYLEEKNKLSSAKKIPTIGMTIPDFTMNDVNDLPFSLSQLRGQYVLVDFWASWCGPCRGENPFVVKAFNKYKNNNFTVLGVSLDEDKNDWLKAIQDDKLTWKHISDLKGWSSAVVSIFGIEGIPYNLLIDPNGKILAKELRENDLDDFLSKTLK